MTFNNSAIIILIVVAFAFYLVYSQNSQPKIYQPLQQSHFKPQLSSQYDSQTGEIYRINNKLASACPPCPKCEGNKQYAQPNPQITNVTIEGNTDPYSDPIKKQDEYSIYDPLTYPQMRLPREVLDKYNEYYDRSGAYPPFGQATQPLFDNPILNGVLIKQVDENEPFSDNVPNSVPLFRVKSTKNSNRYFYYIIDQRHLSKIELKIPLDHIKVNGVRYNNTDYYGIPELFDGDVIEHIPIFPGAKFKVTLYKTYHFP